MEIEVFFKNGLSSKMWIHCWKFPSQKEAEEAFNNAVKSLDNLALYKTTNQEKTDWYIYSVSEWDVASKAKEYWVNGIEKEPYFDVALALLKRALAVSETPGKKLMRYGAKGAFLKMDGTLAFEQGKDC